MLRYIFVCTTSLVTRTKFIQKLFCEKNIANTACCRSAILGIRNTSQITLVTVQSTNICHLHGKSISERRNEFTVRGVPERTLSCRSCVSERYGVANRRHDGTDILFRSLIHRHLYDIVYRLGNDAVKISKLLTSLLASRRRCARRSF